MGRIHGMRRALPSSLIALGVAWLGCRQLAGIDDIELPTMDAGSQDSPSPTDSGPDLVATLEAAYGCDCPTCTTLAAGMYAPASLLLAGGYVYFTNYGPIDGQGSVMRV